MASESKAVVTTTADNRTVIIIAQKILSSAGISSTIDELELTLERNYRLISLNVDKSKHFEAVILLKKYNFGVKKDQYYNVASF